MLRQQFSQQVKHDFKRFVPCLALTIVSSNIVCVCEPPHTKYVFTHTSVPSNKETVNYIGTTNPVSRN